MTSPRTAALLLFSVAFFLFLFEPLRCDVPPKASWAAEFPPAIMITEGKTSHGFPYITGGVGSSERAAMEEKGKGYNLKLVFAERRGSYLADISLVIEGAKGQEIVSVTTDGPWFFIQLPSGTYTVKASYKGEAKQIKNLQVAKDRSIKRTLVWDLGAQSPLES